MSRKFRRILSIVMTFVMCLYMMPNVVLADGNDLDYELVVSIISGSNEPGGTIAATVSIINNTGSEKTLQAFDFYATGSSNVSITGYTDTAQLGAVPEISGSTLHVRKIGKQNNDQSYSNTELTLSAGESVVLGTINATLSSDIKDGDTYSISIDGVGANRANIAVANDDNSHYPLPSTNPGTFHKVYTVTYVDKGLNDDSYVTIGIGTKQHGYNYTISTNLNDNTVFNVNPIPTHSPKQYFGGWATSEYGGTVYTVDGSNVYSTNSDITLYARWPYSDQEVRFLDAWGNIISGSSKSVPYNGHISSTDIPSDEAILNTIGDDEAWGNQSDFEFLGWVPVSGSSDVGSIVAGRNFPGANTGSIISKEDMTNLLITDTTYFAPKFAYKSNLSASFAVAGNYSGVQNMPPTQTGLSVHSKVTAPPSDPSLNGYTFNGWYKESTCNTLWDFDNDEVTSNVTIYAKFTANSYSITYHGNGGEFSSNYTAPASYTYGTEVNLPTSSNISKTGYILAGWYDNSGFDGSPVSAISNTSTGVKEFYAKWTPISYSIRFNSNGGTGNMDNQVFAYGESKELSQNEFTNSGKTFKGWSTSQNPADDSEINYSDKASISNLSTTNNAVIDLYAVWSVDDYSITYNLGGGSVAGSNPTTYSVTSAAISLTNPTRNGYTFTGWTGTGLSEASTSVTIPSGSTGNREYTANWSPISYTVTFDEAGGDAISDLPYNIESTSALGSTSRNGYTFTGWKVTTPAGNWEEDAVLSATETVTDKYGDVTLTAQWTPTNYTVTFNPNGGSAVSAMTYTINSTNTLPTTSKDGYTFNGWKVTTAAGNWVANDNLGITYALNGNYGDVTLTAQWAVINYTISYDGLTDATVSGNPTSYNIESNAITLNNPTKTGYTFAGWTGTGLNEASTSVTIPSGSMGDRSYTATWNIITYEVQFYDKPENAQDKQVIETRTYTIANPTIEAPTVPGKNGYNGAWSSYDLNVLGNKNVYPVYTPIQYTITFNTNGGTAIDQMTYTIESTSTLPAASGKTNHTFDNWKVTTAGGNWAEDSTYNSAYSLTGKYGNVTLTAQWTVDFSYVVEEYKYAYTGYRLLRVKADSLSVDEVYTYNGVVMKYTSDSAYQIDDSPVFYTLIPTSVNTLSDDQIGMISSINGNRTDNIINVSAGHVNGDGVTNIADANTVYQMLTQNSAGGYYSQEQLSTRDRLAADVSSSTTNVEHRASIADVNAIINAINGSN